MVVAPDSLIISIYKSKKEARREKRSIKEVKYMVCYYNLDSLNRQMPEMWNMDRVLKSGITYS